jgi:hypothetical protein
MAVSFSLKGATDASLAVGDEMAVYLGGYGAADVLHRVVADGTEDYVSFATQPAREELTYHVDVSQAAGLRLVPATHTLELVDETGAPRLRVARPYVIDARGKRHEASLALRGCAYDTSGVGPWGRPVTPPGARSCEVHVTWSGVEYPAMVDPKWTLTSQSASKVRQDHTSTTLPNGKVLVAGGDDTSTTWDAADIWDDNTLTFSTTNPMTTPRENFTATLLNNGKVLMVGGVNRAVLPTTYLSSAELYDYNAGSFTGTGSLTLGDRNQHTATLLGNGNVLVAGGRQGGSTVIGTAEIYNGATFAATGSMSARESHTATLLPSGSVLVAGGTTDGTALQTAQLFTGSGFGAAMTMTQARREHTATLLGDGRVLLVGGFGADQTAEVYSGGAFTAITPPKIPHARGYSILLDSGKVLFAHGWDYTGYNKFAELFDPATNTWAYTASVNVARQYPAASKTGNGNVLATGGDLASAERYTIAQAGAACVINDDCRSGSCNDKICCSTTCSGACKTCTAGTGTCTTITSAEDTDSCNGANICSATGSCKLKLGQACNLSTSCASGFCADGVCCNKACSGGCDRCDATGSCNIVTAGTAGENPTCGGFVCDGVNPGCPGSCTNDGDCADGQFCAANGVCTPRKGNGIACNPAVDCKDPACSECTGAACVDGVCCDTTCTGLCQACAAALKQGGPDGKCGPAKEGTNPHNDTCPSDPLVPCGPDGKCSGSGGCRAFAPAGRSCGASQCTDGNKAIGNICSGGGACVNNTVGVSCFDYVCDVATGSCPNSCTDDTQCSPTAYCKAGSCVPKASNGGACTEEKQCASGLCVDGYCCNSTCDGQCEACDVQGAEGTCAPLTGTPHNERPKCAAADPSKPCASATCDGDTRDKCAGFVGPEVRCGAATCADGKATLPGNCRKGECVSAEPVSCGVYACGPTACKTSCETNADCTPGNLCDTATKHCLAQATCDGDHTTTGANGQKQDCSPYKCQGDGTCRQTCTSIDDCVAPTACDPASHKCVPPPPAESADTGGCSTSPSRASSPFGWLIAIAALAATRRRRAA